MKKNEFDEIFKVFSKEYKEIELTNKTLEASKFSIIKEIKYKNKNMVGKIFKIDKNEINGYDNIILFDLHHHNIIKIFKVFNKLINGKKYYLIIMEKAILRDLHKFLEFYNNHNLLKLIFNPFVEILGDNFLRFLSKQIVDGLEIFERNNYSHFNICTENILVSYEMNLKISDFLTLTKKDKNENKKFLKFLKKKNLLPEEFLNKQDFFDLGLTLFYIKFKKILLEYNINKESEINENYQINLIERNINFLKSQKFINKDLSQFLCSLIQYKAKNIPNFEEIYRNKWLNENREEILNINYIFNCDEEKKIMELLKSDYLIKKEKELKNCKIKKFTFKKKRKKNN